MDKAVEVLAILLGVAGLGMTAFEMTLNMPAILMSLSSGMGIGWCAQQIRRKT